MFCAKCGTKIGDGQKFCPSRFGNAVKSAAGWIKDGVDDIKSSGDDLKQAAEMLNGLFN